MDDKSRVLLAVKFAGERKTESFSDAFINRELIYLDDGGSDTEILKGVKYAIVWKPDAELFARLPDLEIIFSAGAGVDHILQAANVPDLPIVRFVDHTLTTRMSEWVCLQCLMHLRQQRQYDEAQRERKWHERPQPQASEITVGIMGLGVLGQDSAQKLKTLGFNVLGWSRTKKEIDDVECFDQQGLDSFLSQTDIVVGLLPLTDETTGIFNRELFEKLHKNDEIASPVFINGGRGKSQIEADIVACLKDGTLGGVSLDVFEAEPLSTDSQLWDFDQAILTPHMAASTDATAISFHVNQQIDRYEAGLELEYLVDRSRGY